MGLFDPRRNAHAGQPQGPRTGWINPRWIVALLIAIVGLFMYWNQTQVNPITGEKQHVAISPEQEVKLGLESAPAMAEEMGGEMQASDPRTQEVKKIGHGLLGAYGVTNTPWHFQFHLLADNKTVNAFALPGGQVFITLGLLNELQNEAQLAGVVGHEIGHVIERHSAEQMAKSQLGKFLIVAIGAGASDPKTSGTSTDPVVIASMVNQMIQLRYSRKDESEADIWGLRFMEKAGYNPAAMIDVMEILKKAGGGGNVPSIFQSHPNPDLRIEQIKAYLKEHPPQGSLSEGKILRQGVPAGTH